MAEKLPEHFVRFRKAYPDIYEAFEELGRRLHESGPLSERERRLVKLGIAIGVGTEGGVHSAVRFARAGGCSDDDVAHVVRLAITTIGWPSAQAAMSWIADEGTIGRGAKGGTTGRRGGGTVPAGGGTAPARGRGKR